MSGHSKWHSIKHKKGAADAARGKVFTKHANLITIAARDGGGDPEMNPALRLAIQNAKADNTPNANIERAIKRGTGEDKDGVQFFEVQYEGYGPAGVAIIVNAITDNKNRTVASVRSAFSKNGGNMGETGCVGWMFSKNGIITLPITPDTQEDTELVAIDAGAEDVTVQGDALHITTAPEDLYQVKDGLEQQNLTITNAELTLIPQNTVKITNAEDARKVMRLIEALEDDLDVSTVSDNSEISPEILQEISQ